MIFEASLSKSYTTHIGVLARVVQASHGDVLEFGTGPFSTPLLHWLCKDMNRLLISYENSPEFYKFARQFQSKLHRTRFIQDYKDVDIKTHCGLVFIDQHPSRSRGKIAIAFKDSADYIVMHDTEKEKTYGYDKAFTHFKYKYTWKESLPFTSVVSNYHDLSWLTKK